MISIFLLSIFIIPALSDHPRENSKLSESFQTSNGRLESVQTFYGPPNDSGRPTNDDANIDNRRKVLLNEKLRQGNAVTNNVGGGGIYYIFHPNGLLQKVVYFTEDNPDEMAFAAKLKYQNIEPIVGPVYTYDPKTFVFSRLK